MAALKTKPAPDKSPQQPEENEPPRIAQRSLESLIPYARNARTHSDEQLAQLSASIAEFGWTNPILADERGILAGHGRVAAARLLYSAGQRIKLPDGRLLPEGTVPVIDCTGWSESKRRAYIIADNKLALNAGWDFEALRIEVADLLGDEDASTLQELLGFSQAEIDQLTLDPQAGETDAAAHWTGMPEYEDQEPCFRKIIVNFDNAESVASFFRLIGQSYTDKTKSIWHPYKPNRDLASQAWSGSTPPAEDAETPESVDASPTIPA